MDFAVQPSQGKLGLKAHFMTLFGRRKTTYVGTHTHICGNTFVCVFGSGSKQGVFLLQ